jgi:hypothetical protein
MKERKKERTKERKNERKKEINGIHYILRIPTSKYNVM